MCQKTLTGHIFPPCGQIIQLHLTKSRMDSKHDLMQKNIHRFLWVLHIVMKCGGRGGIEVHGLPSCHGWPLSSDLLLGRCLSSSEEQQSSCSGLFFSFPLQVERICPLPVPRCQLSPGQFPWACPPTSSLQPCPADTQHSGDTSRFSAVY